MIRETIFNLIGQDATGLEVLDLFAGTGSLGIEALSRGASRAVFIDNSTSSINIIKKNLKLCGFDRSGFILKRDLRQGLSINHPSFGKTFDLIFIDPPYGKDLIPDTLTELSINMVPNPSSIIVAESLKEDKLPVRMGSINLFDERTYGSTKLSIYKSEET